MNSDKVVGKMGTWLNGLAVAIIGALVIGIACLWQFRGEIGQHKKDSPAVARLASIIESGTGYTFVPPKQKFQREKHHVMQIRRNLIESY